MIQKPIISICIPTYKRSKTLKEWLDSITRQFDGKIEKKIEIIIADDASPDDTEHMVREYMKKYDNIAYYRYPNNKWLTYNITAVTNFAHWEYLRLFTDDDCMTDFSLKYVIEIIEKSSFDLMICNAHFGSDMQIHIDKKANTYKTLHWINNFVDYLFDHRRTYQQLMVYFSFYSVIVVNHKYFKDSLALQDQDFIYQNIFPQDIIIYTQIKKDKTIIIPDNIFTIWRTLNESYKTSMKFVTDFNVTMDMIEWANWLQWSKKWKILKRICVSWRRKTILLWFLLRWLHIDYKKNFIFKKLYEFYKKHIQNQTA